MKKKVDLSKILESGAQLLQRNELKKILGGDSPFFQQRCVGISCSTNRDCTDKFCERCDIDGGEGLCAT